MYTHTHLLLCNVDSLRSHIVINACDCFVFQHENCIFSPNKAYIDGMNWVVLAQQTFILRLQYIFDVFQFETTLSHFPRSIGNFRWKDAVMPISTSKTLSERGKHQSRLNSFSISFLYRKVSLKWAWSQSTGIMFSTLVRGDELMLVGALVLFYFVFKSFVSNV